MNLLIKPYGGVIALGDQNSDGYDDILLYDCNEGKAYIYFGGNPISKTPALVINKSAIAIHTLDINHDGKEDIILSYVTPDEKEEVFWDIVSAGTDFHSRNIWRTVRSKLVCMCHNTKVSLSYQFSLGFAIKRAMPGYLTKDIAKSF